MKESQRHLPIYRYIRESSERIKIEGEFNREGCEGLLSLEKWKSRDNSVAF